ncbi:unnamed protein product, partial [Symbiodinium sp. CCMP2456]
DSDASSEELPASFDLSSLRLVAPAGNLPRVDQASDAEKFAVRVLGKGRITLGEFDMLCGLLPSDPESRATSGDFTSKTFMSGMYQHGGVIGLRTHMTSHPWTTAVLCAILRAAFPVQPFTSVVVSRNRQIVPHRDSQNGDYTWNLLVPEPMEYEGETRWGKILPVATGPQLLDPRRLHATMDWKGVRTVVIGFSIRDPEKASRQVKASWKRVSGLQDTTQTDEAVARGRGSTVRLQERGAGEEGDTFHGHLVQARKDNFGDPITVQWRGKVHSFVDGCGLNSPGRWRPAARGRGFPQDTEAFVQSLRNLLDGFIRSEIGDVRRAYFMLALGKYEEAPFSEQAMDRLRSSWFALLEDPASAAHREPGQPFFLEALSQTCRAMGDEDWEVLTRAEDNYARGRRLGVGRPFERVVAVFRPKGKWREYDESEFQAMNENYASAKAVPEQLEKQFEEEEALGFMYPLSEKEARRRFGDTLRVASLGAIIKDDGTVRALFDGTHSVKLNNLITIADKLEFPTPSNAARATEIQQEDGNHLLVGIAADIAKAHRLVYAGQVLYWLRPFMGPLHRWKAAIAPGTVALVPRMVMVVLRYI